MKLTDKILVTGIRRFEGEVDGTKHDFTKMTYSSLTDTLSNDREKGSFPKEILVGDSRLFNDLSVIEYPAVFEATFNLQQTRKGLNLTLDSYEFISSVHI